MDEYGIRLHELNETIGIQDGHEGEITLKSLEEIFRCDPNEIFHGEELFDKELPILEHFLDTKISNETEFHRHVLMLACQPDRNSLRSKIKNQDLAIVSLYRGFSRFMLEDLALHPHSQSISRSQRKKVAEKISFEMLLRNQAYSNLVDLFFPFHVRLSIHAHVNSGPKFGISLFDKSNTRVVNSINDLLSTANESHDLLHIPTPWHNCVFRVSGDDFTYITKSKVIHEAREAKLIRAHWVNQDQNSASGGYFQIHAPGRTRRTRSNNVEDSKSPLVSSVPGRDVLATEDTVVKEKGTEKPSRIIMHHRIKGLFRYKIRIFRSRAPTSMLHRK